MQREQGVASHPSEPPRALAMWFARPPFLSHLKDLEDAGTDDDEDKEEQEARTHGVRLLLLVNFASRYLRVR